MAPFAPEFLPATFSPSHAPNSLPIMGAYSSPRVWDSTRRVWRMFPTEPWEKPPTLGWENPPTALAERRFSQFSWIGTFLD
jgi:hypothetical protein